MRTREVKLTLCHPLAMGLSNLSQQYPNSRGVGIKNHSGSIKEDTMVGHKEISQQKK
jgi:hypothetical protein